MPLDVCTAFVGRDEVALSGLRWRWMRAVARLVTVGRRLVARLVSMDPYLLWKRLGLPSFIVLALPENQFITLENLSHDSLR